jgi:hypothetical protein
LKTLKILAVVAIIGCMLLALQTAAPDLNIPNAILAALEFIPKLLVILWNGLASGLQKLA